MKTIYLLTSAFLCLSGVGLSIVANAQCGVPTPPSYVACGGGGQTALRSVSILSNSTYYYNGSGGINAIIMANGTLLVCGNLTITTSIISGGTIIIEPAGALTLTYTGNTTSGTKIVNYGSLNLNMGTGTYTATASIYNYGSADFTGALTMNAGDALYNGSLGSSMVISGNLTTSGSMVNNGAITVKGTYEFKNTLCLGGGSQLGVNELEQTNTASKVTVSASPSGGTTALIGITSSLVTSSSLTNTGDLVLCEGPHIAAGGNPGSATIDHNCTLTTLPITLVSFSAEAENNICTLQWTTAKQVGLVNFEVEYSTDAVNYQTLDILPAEREADSYAYTTSIKENTWFRLRMVNEDSSYAYSSIVPVNFKEGGPGEAYLLRVQPNLITGNTLEVWSNMVAGQSGEWWVVDMMGRTMLRQPAQLGAGTTTHTIQLPTLFPGIYRLLFVGSQVRLSPVPFSVMR